MAISLGDIKNTVNKTVSNLNVGGVLSDNFSISGTINNIKQSLDKVGSGVNSELKELYSPTVAETLQYPADLPKDHYMMFSIMRRIPFSEQKNNPQTKQRALQTVVLPIPVNLQDARTVNYNTTDLGGLGGLGAGQIGAEQLYTDLSRATQRFGRQALNRAFGNVKGLKDSLITQFESNPGEALTNLAITGTTVAALSKMGLGTLAGAAGLVKYGQGVFFAEGTALNPRMANIFDRVSFREFGFSYKMIARNAAESEQIRNIVRAFQTNMLPSYYGVSQSGFNYPREFQIEFSKPLQSTLFKFQPCILKNVTVNYNSDTGPAFFEKTNEPLVVDISLQFQETKILTREADAEEISAEQDREMLYWEQNGDFGD